MKFVLLIALIGCIIAVAIIAIDRAAVTADLMVPIAAFSLTTALFRYQGLRGDGFTAAY